MATGRTGPDPAEPVPATSSGVPHTSTQATIVIADDEPDIVFLLERLLGDTFRVVGTAQDGEAAIEAVTEWHPDIVLLDLTMPRLDGESALPEIVRHAPETMVAILSGHMDDDRAQRLLLGGAFAAYEKGELTHVESMLVEDLARFRRVLAGEDDVPAWKHRYELS